jgi:hypothetical protein
VHRGYNQEASELFEKEVAAAVGAAK